MITVNDRAAIRNLIADVVYMDAVQTTDDTPYTVRTYDMTGAEMIDIEIICHAIASGGGFVSRMAKTFYYDGASVTTGGDWGYITKEYLSTGLSTCDFSFDVTDNVISVVWTGEAGKNITASFRIYINRMFDDSLLP